MASIAAILATEALLAPQIHLYREGLFWKGYQHSAYRVTRWRSSLKLQKKFVKVVSCEVVSLGFPHPSLARIFPQAEITYLDENHICIADGVIDMEAYQQWFEAVSLTDTAATTASVRQGSLSEPSGLAVDLLRKISAFPLEQSTPMECMLFLTRMRKELTTYGNI